MSPERSYTSPYPPIAVPTDQSVSQFLLSQNPDDVSPDKVILRDFHDSNRVLTFGGLRREAAKASSGLRKHLNLQQGDIVCICGYNSVNWALLAHAVLWSGACFSAINPVATSHELVHYLEIAEPNIVAVDAEALPKLRTALEHARLNIKPDLVLIDDGHPTYHNSLPQFPRDIVTPGLPEFAPVDFSSKDNRTIPAGMIFSSGTSGKPKGVLLSHHALIAHLLTIRATNPFTHNGHMREAFYPPFAHIYGIVSAVLLSAFVGSYVVVMKQFEFLPYLQRCAEIRATVLRLVPATAVRLIKDPAAKLLDLSSVNTIMCSGATLPTEVVEELRIMLNGSHILNGYGMSEGTITLLRETQSEVKAGCVGKPAAGVLIRIVDNENRDVTPGEEGECLVKGPTLLMGYKNNRTETGTTLENGWLRTGDIVKVDEDGFVWLTGRKKELIKYKGNQISPTELEGILVSHPSVTDAGVCGAWDQAQATEVPVGYVTLVASISEMERDAELGKIKAFVDERVSPFKRLRGGLFFMDTLPKGNTGKLLRRQLPANVQQKQKAKL